METDPNRACVIGNGGWGTALALLLLSRGRDVALWGHSKEELDDIRARGENVPYLPGVTVRGELRLTDDPAEAARREEAFERELAGLLADERRLAFA